MKDFQEWTYKDAVAEIEARKADQVSADGYKANRAIVEEHDSWQNGDHWVGPRGTPAAWETALRESVRKQHVPGAASVEALSNFVRGLFGREANIQAVPIRPVVEGSTEEEAAKREAEKLIALLSVWWDRVGLWRLTRLAGMRSRWATWATLRLWIPEGHLDRDDDGSLRLPTFTKLEEALAAIDLSAPEPDHCIVLVHPATQDEAAVFHFAEKDENGKETKRVELWYQVGDKTALRLLPENGEPEGPFTYDWGGRLPVAEVEGELMLTEFVRRQEAALDFAETNVVKVGETAGFRERYTTNAEPNGLWLPTPPTDGPVRTTTDGAGRTLYLHLMPRSLGPAITTDLIGIKTKTDDGKETRATPGVQFADPVDPEFAIRGAEYRRSRVLQLCSQGHLAMSGKAESSGFAYEQARAAFRGDLEWHKSPAERAIMQLLEALIAMAESMSSEKPRWMEKYRLIVTLTVDPGPVSPAVIEQTITMVEKALLSRATAMGRMGVEDVAAELEAISQEPGSMLELRRKQLEAVQLLVGEGMTWLRAATIIGIEDDALLAEFKAQDAEDAAERTQEDDQDDEIDDALRPPEPAVA